MTNNFFWTENEETIITENSWLILADGFDPMHERELETIFSFGNGYIGTRNSLEECYDFCDPATFVAGIYEPVPEKNYNALVEAPNWTRIYVYLQDKLLTLIDFEIIEHKRYLDLKKGITARKWRCQDDEGRITNITIFKYISLENKNIAFKSLLLKPENYTDKLRVVVGIDARDSTLDLLEQKKNKESKLITLSMKSQNNDIIAISQKSNFFKVSQSENEVLSSPSKFNLDIEKTEDKSIKYLQSYNDDILYEEWEWLAEYGNQYSINSILSIVSTKDSSNPAKVSEEMIVNFNKNSIDEYTSSHIQSWKNHWDNINLTISNDTFSQQLVNFALYHLINSAEFNGDFTSIPARNLSGDSYLGHIFWDTEIYLLPFYIFTEPDIAKKLLMYRYNTLPGARENAKNEGFEGVSYAWESTDTGLEATPTQTISPFGEVIHIYSGKYENHIGPDIAYAVWQYWQVTRDEDFLVNYGSEMIFEIARFCESLLIENNDGYYHIYNAIGPDEYHEKVDDNAYTNLMVQHSFEIAVSLANYLKEFHKEKYKNLKSKIDLKEEEIKSWNNLKDKIYINYNSETNLYEQFNGYFDLEYIDVKTYEPRNVPMDVILGRERTRKSQVIKQPDVVMFLFLLANKFSQDIIETNYNYYEPRTAHGSSLSPSIYSIVAARLGKMDQAFKYFKQNAEIDLGNNMRNAAGGVHMAAMGGVWMSIVMGFAGLQVYDRGLLLDPHLPVEWDKLEFSIYWRQQRVNLQIKSTEIKLEISGDKSIDLTVGLDNWKELEPNNTYVAYKKDKWYWK